TQLADNFTKVNIGECRRRRGGSCSSSDLSDDDSEKKKRAADHLPPPDRARRDSHDDSSDRLVQDPAIEQVRVYKTIVQSTLFSIVPRQRFERESLALDILRN
ncbi:hypothetical protein ACJJTC_015009, partial [Scirpophaga incertulas]